jgi:hypothetical protein
MHNEMQKFVKNNKNQMKKMDQIVYKIEFDDLESQTKGIKKLLYDIVSKSSEKISETIKTLIKAF